MPYFVDRPVLMQLERPASFDNERTHAVSITTRERVGKRAAAPDVRTHPLPGGGRTDDFMSPQL